MNATRSSSKKRTLLFILLGVILLCPLSAGIFALSNLRLPEASSQPELLSEADKARLAETSHLRETLGGQIWAGFEHFAVPVILYNESYAFLTGYPDPPAGWIKVPEAKVRGGEWELVPGDEVNGQPYYRQRVEDPADQIGAFTVKVGERWAASMTTLEWSRIRLRQYMRQDLPGFIQPIFPYGLAASLFDSDTQILGVLHESFHAYQGTQVAANLFAAEQSVRSQGNVYPWDDAELQADWEVELGYLTQALKADDLNDASNYTRQFLQMRQTRREQAKLSSELVQYERQREWLEGLGVYTELSFYRLANEMDAYSPVAEIQGDALFHDYRNFQRRWADELRRLPNPSDDGDSRFYGAGMAQAFLLDQLMTNWKDRAFDEDIALEDLLSEALD